MLSQEDLFVLKVACKEGKLNPEILKKHFNQSPQSEVPLRKILLEQGFFSPKEWEECRKKGENIFGYPETETYLNWENNFLWKQLSSIYPAEEITRLIPLYEFARTKQEALLTLLLATGVVPPKAARKIFQMETHREMVCPKCNLSLKLIQYFPWRKYPCPLCDKMIQPAQQPSSVDPLQETRVEETKIQDRHHRPEEIAPYSSPNIRWKHQAISKKQATPPPSLGKKSAAQKWGKYDLVGILGKGGSGLIYLARDPDTGREVALKVLSLVEIEVRHLKRFELEMELLKRLDHPGIVHIYHWDIWEGKPYFAMDYIKGKNLWDYVKDQASLELEEALSILQAVCEAVKYAHSQGVIHRDIKPENILIDEDGKVFLMDFGLAKDLSDWHESLTETGYILGTPDFMAPEQALGEKTIGVATDIFALGGLLYFMLSGSPPFVHDNVFEVFRKVIEDDPEPLRNFKPDLPSKIENIVQKCLQKQMDQRYQEVEDLEKALVAPESSLAVFEKISFGKISPWKRAFLGLSILIVILISVLWQFGGHQKKTEKKFPRNSPPQPTFEQLYQRGLALGQKKSYGPALIFWQKALALKPNHLDTLFQRGITLLKLGHFSLAQRDLKKALALNPSFAKGHYGLGLLFFALKRNKEALDELDQALAQNPQLFPAYLVRGKIYLQGEEFESALRNFQMALKQNLQKGESLYWRGMVFLKMGQIQKAHRDFKQVLKVQPNTPYKIEIQKILNQ